MIKKDNYHIMKSSDQLMLESLYGAMYKNPDLAYGKKFNEQEIAKLLEQDLATIEELIEEGVLGDIASKVKQGASSLANKAKEAVSGLKQGVTNTIVKKVIDSVMSKLSDQDKAKVFGMLVDGKVDKGAVQELKQNVAGQQVQESFLGTAIFEDDKTFFVNTFFTEEVLTEAIKNTNFISKYNELLTEAEAVGAPVGNRPLRQAMKFADQEAEKMAVNMVTRLKELYGKSPRYLKQALPKVMDSVNKKVNKIFQDNLGASGAKADSVDPASGETTSPASGEVAASAEGKPAEASASKPKKAGFIQRVLKFISNPKVYVTAGLAVAIIGFIAAVVGGAPIASMLGIYATKMAYGAGGKMLWGAVSRKMQGKKIFDAKELASDAGKGALMGAVSAGIASIVAVVSPLVKGLFGAGEVAAQAGAPSQGTVDQFPGAHATSYDAASKLDQGKAGFMDALKDRGIVGKGQWANGASPAFTNAAGDMKLDSASYQKLADKIHSMSDSEISNLIQQKDAGSQENAMKVAKDAIMKLLGKK